MVYFDTSAKVLILARVRGLLPEGSEGDNHTSVESFFARVLNNTFTFVCLSLQFDYAVIKIFAAVNTIFYISYTVSYIYTHPHTHTRTQVRTLARTHI